MDPDAAAPRRLHPSSLLFDAGRRFASLVFWTLAVLFFAARSEERWYLLFLLPPFVQALIRFASFRYAFGDGELVVREGVLTRSVRHVPYGRIQNIDTVQGPLHRLLGVVEVRLETAGGSEPEAVFRVITSAQLAELRTRVFGAPRAADGPAGIDAGEQERARGEAAEAGATAFFRMSAQDVALFGLLEQRGLVVLGGAFVALRELADLDRLRERLGLDIERASEGLLALGRPAWIALALAGFVVLQLGSVLWATLTLHGFRIERRGEDLRTTCGLLTKQTASLPRARVQFLEVRQGVLQRLLARLSVRAVSAGGDSTRDSQIARKWLVPLCRAAALDGILSEVQPEAAFGAVDWRRVHPRAARRMVLRGLLWLALPVLGAFALSWIAGIAAGIVALGLAGLLAHLRVRTLRWALGPRAVFLRDGRLGRRLACVRFEKIQSISLRQSPMDRRARMAHVALDTAGASGSRARFVVPYLGLREALRLVAHLRREAAAVTFRW